jgi:hypothetical protein
MQFVETVQVGARKPERLALVKVPAQADVAVRQRKHRLRLGQGVEM